MQGIRKIAVFFFWDTDPIPCGGSPRLLSFIYGDDDLDTHYYKNITNKEIADKYFLL